MISALVRVALCGVLVVMACKPREAPPATGSGTGSGAGTAAPAADAARDDAARQFAAWLAVFNAGEPAAMVAYHEASFPYDIPGGLGDVDHELEFHAATGGFDVKKVEESTATRYTAVLKERGSDQFARATMDVTAEEPHRAREFQIRAIPTPDELRAPRMTQDDAIKALRAELDAVVARDGFSGAVLIARDGAPLFAQAYGLADREHKVPNKLETRFRIGSMNKMFTAVAILQLVQAGKLALTDPVGKHLRDYPNKAVATVTVEQLLTHTGGTGDIFGPDFDAQRLKLRTIADYVKLYGARDPRHDPGQKWEYSNYGFILLGAIIERVTRQSYYDWVNAQVFQPAGMASTSSPIEGAAVPGRSIGYMRPDPDKPWLPNTETLPVRATSAGGGDSTVGDLLRFATALTGHKLLDAEHTAMLIAGKQATPRGSKYAFGFEDELVGGVRCFGHGGGAPGMNGALDICPPYVIAVLANLDPPAATRVANFIKNRLPAK